MKVKYREGDVFSISLSNGKYAICQVVFSPENKFKKIIGFCVLSVQNDEVFSRDMLHNFISIEKFGKQTKVLFSGNQKITDGSWKIINNVELGDEGDQFKVFNYAGGLYHGEIEIKRIPVAEYADYTTMSVSGFDLVDNILISID